MRPGNSDVLMRLAAFCSEMCCL